MRMLNESELRAIKEHLNPSVVTPEEFEKLFDSFLVAVEGNSRLFFAQLDFLFYKYSDSAFFESFLQQITDVYMMLMSSVDSERKRAFAKDIYRQIISHVFKRRHKELERIKEHAFIVENMLQHMTSMLTEKLKTQQLMMGNISHEMRTFLNAIQGYNMIALENKNLDTKTKGYLVKANQATVSLRDMVDDILSLTKINVGQLEINNEWFWIDEVILHSIDQVKANALKKGLEFRFEISFFSTPYFGDSKRIREIIINLLSNAVKFTDKGYVSFRVENIPVPGEEETRIRFIVQDSGIGMSSEAVQNIFDPFIRFEKERQGVGLGLHISHSLAKKMGGELQVESEPYIGSTFTFTLQLPKDSSSRIELSGEKVWLFNDGKNEKNTIEVDKRVELLESIGADVDVYTSDEMLIRMAMSTAVEPPQILFVSTLAENYRRLNFLVAYLRGLEKFNHTVFIAEDVPDIEQTLNAFDYIYEYFAPISLFGQIGKKRDGRSQQCNEEITILAVDDIATNLEVLKLFISKEFPQCRIDLASGGYEAIGMYKTNHYDLLLLDLKMPGLDGISLFKKLKTIRNTPTTYALTADVYEDTMKKILEAGFDGLIEKPIRPDRLFGLIRKNMCLA